MAVNTKLELYIELSLIKALVDVAGATPVQIDGVRDGLDEGTEEWFAIDVLTHLPEPTRAGVWRGAITFQVSCFSKFGHLRADGKVKRPLEMAGIVRGIFNQKDVCIQDLDAGSPVDIAFLRCQELNLIPIKEAKSGGGRTIPDDELPTNWHGVAQTYSGTISNS